jgi:hypothetical protein
VGAGDPAYTLAHHSLRHFTSLASAIAHYSSWCGEVGFKEKVQFCWKRAKAASADQPPTRDGQLLLDLQPVVIVSMPCLHTLPGSGAESRM